MTKLLDGYELFFEFFPEVTHEKMLRFGIDNLISVPFKNAKTEWEKIKKCLYNNEELFIRGYGRDAAGTNLYFHLYTELFKNTNIKKDSTNNHNPTKCILEWTNHSKSKLTQKQIELGTKQIQNFQISHVFGQTKNPLLFTAPWNIIVLPKIMDPFTGHEAKGTLKDNFTKALQEHILNKYRELIDDYNTIANDSLRLTIRTIIEKMKSDKEFSKSNLDKFLNDALSEWANISI